MAVFYKGLKGVIYNRGKKMGLGYQKSVLVYQSAVPAAVITYCVDSGTSYTESIKVGNSILSPTSFTPSKSGYTFVGWRSDATANSSVLSGTTATEDTTLYAVFKKDVTLTYYDNSSTAKTKPGTIYYNNGTANNPSFTMIQASSSGWTARGWSTSNAGNASISYSNGATITLTGDLTIYGLYQQTITVTYYNNSGSASSTQGTRYWAPAGYINPSFTLSQASKSGWTARGWSTSNSGSAGITYNNGATFTRDSNITLYGLYYTTIYVYYNANGGSGSTSSQYGTIYWAPAGTIGASFSLRSNGFSAPSNHAFSQWALGSASGTKYNAGASVTLTSSTTFYAIWTYIGATYNTPSIYATSSNLIDYGGDSNGSEVGEEDMVMPKYTISSNKVQFDGVIKHCEYDVNGRTSATYNCTGASKCTIYYSCSQGGGRITVTVTIGGKSTSFVCQDATNNGSVTLTGISGTTAMTFKANWYVNDGYTTTKSQWVQFNKIVLS